MNKTKIEWCWGLTANHNGRKVERTGFTWNPTRGCSAVSTGCLNCYAGMIATRFSGEGRVFDGYARRHRTGRGGAAWTGKVDLLPSKLCDPLKVRHPGAVFVNSMSDLFHPELSFEDIAAVVGVIAASPHHLMMTLTKHAKRMRGWFEWIVEGRQHPAARCASEAAATLASSDIVPRRAVLELSGSSEMYPEDLSWPLANWRIGVSAEDQQRWDERVPELLRCPAAFRFVSAEPLLSRIDVEQGSEIRGGVGGSLNPLSGEWWAATGCPYEDFRSKESGPAIDQIILGGESGPLARACRFEWIDSIVSQCKAADCSVFIKQGGSNAFWEELAGQPLRWFMKHNKGGDPTEWPLGLDRFPREVV